MPESATTWESDVGKIEQAHHSSPIWDDRPRYELKNTKVGSGLVSISTYRNDSEWVAYAIERLNRIFQLPENWDSYGASPVTQGALEQALKLYLKLTENREMNELPQIAPTVDGGVALLWHHDERGLEVEIEGALQVHGYYYDDIDNSEWSEDVNIEWKVLHGYLDRVYA